MSLTLVRPGQCPRPRRIARSAVDGGEFSRPVYKIAGVRRIPSAQAALIGTLELVLAPLWVWAAFAEVPATSALLGGLVNALAVIVRIFMGMRDERHTAKRRNRGA